ncbi:hypothetical protein ACQ4PT_001970 [Festuca glaucescens]
MERVEDPLGNLKLSEAEVEGLKIGGREMDVGGRKQLEQMDPKALVRVFSEKPASAEGLSQALGNIWCPMKGIRCKSMGANIFMITFLQASGKRKALDNGPWKFNNDLVVVVDFDPDKTLEEYVFNTTPIWVRVLKLPLGRMERATGEMIGDKVGEYIDVDVGEDGFAVGEYLRVKVKLDITKPLMRGMMFQVGDDGRSRWCPFEYEYLPEFCYTCGILGHEAIGCSIRVKRGEKQQFGAWLRAFIPRKPNSGDRQKWSGGGGSSSGGRSYGFGVRKGNAGSNSLSWRKEDASKVDSGSGEEKLAAGDKVTSPLKRPFADTHTISSTNKKLELYTEGKNQSSEGTKLHSQVDQQLETIADGGIQNPRLRESSEETKILVNVVDKKDIGKEQPVHGTIQVKEKEGIHGGRNDKESRGKYLKKERKGAGSNEKLGVMLE